MATDIGFLTLGLDGHALELGTGLDGLVKTWGNLRNCFFLCTRFSLVDSLAIALLNITICLPVSPQLLPLTLLKPLVSSLLLDSPGSLP
jgi:hypothetical protein